LKDGRKDEEKEALWDKVRAAVKAHDSERVWGSVLAVR